MATFTYRVRAKRPTWNAYDVANASVNTYTTVTSAGGNALKVFVPTAIIHPFNFTMCDVKKVTDGLIAVTALSVYTYNMIPDKYKINYTANPELSGKANYFICFDYGGLAHALGFVVETCGE